MSDRNNILVPVLSAMALAIAAGVVWSWDKYSASVASEDDIASMTLMASLSGIGSGEVKATIEQEPLKAKSKQQEVKDFRINDTDEFATLRDDVFFTTSDVIELVPDSAQSNFAPGQKVYVFAALRAPREERVRLTWYGPSGNEILPSAYFDVEANTGPVGYRIFSYRSFRNPGDYRVAVFNSAGRQIGETAFVVE